VTSDALSLHYEAVVVDTHNDLLCSVVIRPVHRWADYFRENWLPQLRAGGVDVQVLPVWVDDPLRPEGALRRTLRMIEAAHRIAEGNADEVALCTDGAQVDAVVADGRIALVLALESCPGIAEDVELLTTAHRLGVRMASLTHFGRSPFGDGSAEDATGSRLTSAGVAAIAEMERLGVLVDISHLGRSGVDHVLGVATRPVIASHSSARALRDHHRNLADDHLRAVSAGGGVVCVNFYPGFLAEHDAGLGHLVEHLEHVMDVAGIDHVGIGPDFVREVELDITPPGVELEAVAGCGPDAVLPGLDGPAELPALTAELLRHGWPPDKVCAVLGGNCLRLFHDHLGVPAGSGRPVAASA
jgi:membrane dipeptidase